MVAQGVDGAAPLRAVPDDDGVVPHALPPSTVKQSASPLVGQHLEGGTDQQHQEGDAQRGDNEGIDESRMGRDRGDVTVTSRGHGNRRVVEGVDQGDAVTGGGINIGVMVDPDDQGTGQQQNR